MRRPVFIAQQSSHPSGLLGRWIARIMWYETVHENERTLDLLEIEPSHRVLEIGFGPGRALARALALARNGHVSGVEVSSEMLDQARARHPAELREGRIDLQRVLDPRLPYRDATFDRAYSVHTIYFWRDAVPRLREIRRVLRPGGRFVLAFRYGEEAVANLPAEVYEHREPAETVRLLREAGFESVDLHEDPPLYYAVAARSG